MDTNGRKLDTIARLAKQILAATGAQSDAKNAAELLGPPCRKCQQRKKGRYKREMCLACYQEADRAIRDKKTTWDELEQLGIAGPASKGGRPTKAASGKGLLELIESLRRSHPRVVKALSEAKADAEPDTPRITHEGSEQGSA